MTASAGMRARLTAWVAGVLLICTAVIFLVVYDQTGSQLRSQIDHDLKGAAGQLQQSLTGLQADSAVELLGAARSYAAARPYSQASTLLFVLVPGAGAASNHPELFGSKSSDKGETASEQSTENALGHRLLVPHTGYATLTLPDVGAMRTYESAATVAGVKLYAGAGQPLATVSRAQRSVARSFLLAGALTVTLALLASYFAGARVSAPLRRLASVAARVDAGDLAPRMHVETSATSEVSVLAEAFNHMLDRLAEAFAAQREFIADASHELRTPLTVIRGQLEILAAQERPDGDEVRRVERLVDAEIARITRLVEDLLLLAQSDRADFLRVKPIPLDTFVSELWDGVRLTAQRRFELEPVPNAMLDADPDRLTQALRNLTGNAIQHTSEPDGLVRLAVGQPKRGVARFTVTDDGPGIPPDERDRVFERFHRTDPARSRADGGAGLGLAIVKAIADAHHGTVRAREAPGGGAMIELELPGLVSTRGAEG